jgi:hypothetical protein
LGLLEGLQTSNVGKRRHPNRKITGRPAVYIKGVNHQLAWPVSSALGFLRGITSTEPGDIAWERYNLPHLGGKLPPL